MIATKPNAKIIQIGTVHTDNHFYQAGYGEDSPYTTHTIPYQIVLDTGLFTPEFVEEMRRELTPMGFKREMMCELVEMEDAYFKPVEIITEAVDMDWKQIVRQHGHQRFYLGADIARHGSDETVIIIVQINGDNATIAYMESYSDKPLTHTIGRIQYLSDQYKTEINSIDETSLGGGVVDMISESRQEYKLGHLNPITFTQQSKMDLMDNLLIMLMQGRLKIPNDHKLIAQLRDYRYEVTSTGKLKLHHSDRGHDDYVDSLALAVFPFRDNAQSPLFFGVRGR